MRIGVLLPNATDLRWTALDGPELQAAIASAVPGATVDERNAAGDAATQQQQAQAALAAGDCVLVVAPVDTTKAAQIVAAASAGGVPVIAYDSLIESKDTPYFVGFDEVGVGKLIGQYVVDHFGDFGRAGNRNAALINGDQRDPRSISILTGEREQLQPLFDNGTLRLIYDQFTPGGGADTARTETEGVLTANQNNVSLVVTSGDALASGAIGALKAARLNGKVLVTGAGATVDAVKAILMGDQAMTVELNPKLEAGATGKLVGALNAGSGTAPIVTGTTQTAGGATIPSVLETPVAVDRTNIAATVVADGLLTVGQICAGLPPGTGGVCP